MNYYRLVGYKGRLSIRPWNTVDRVYAPTIFCAVAKYVEYVWYLYDTIRNHTSYF
jgi:hypothetical protein